MTTEPRFWSEIKCGDTVRDTYTKRIGVVSFVQRGDVYVSFPGIPGRRVVSHARLVVLQEQTV